MPLPDIEPASLGMGGFSNNKTSTGGGLFDGIGGKEESTNATSGIGEMFKNPPIGNGLDFDSGEDEEENKKFEKLEIDKIEIKTAEIGKLIVDSLVTKDEEEKSTVEEQEEDKKSEMAEKILPSLAEESKEIPDILGDSSNEPKTAIDKETQLDTTKPLSTIFEPMVSETPEETATVLEPMVSKDALEEDKTEATEEKPGIMDWALNPIGTGIGAGMDMLFGDDEETAVTDGQMQKEQPTEEKPGIMDWALNPIGTGMDMLFGDDEKSTPEDDTDDVLIDIRDIISEFDLSGGSDVSENLLEETITPPTEATESTEEKSGIMDTLWDTSPIGMISNLLKGDDEEVSNQKTNTETVTNNTENLESQTKTIEENVELKTIEDAQVTIPPNISEQQNKQQGKSSFYSQPNQNTTSPPADPGPKYTKNPPPPVPVGKSISKELQTYIMVPQWRRMLG